jgi:hypothetical protein
VISKQEGIKMSPTSSEDKPFIGGRLSKIFFLKFAPEEQRSRSFP